MKDGLRVSDYEYQLPPGRIARYPTERRDQSRMLVVPRGGGPFEHRRFSDLLDLLTPGDVLVVNESRVRLARLLGRKPTGASSEIMLLRPSGRGAEPHSNPGDRAYHDEATLWEALVRPGGKLKPGRVVNIARGFDVEILDSAPGGGRVVRLVVQGSVREALEKHGHVPLPPYLERDDEPLDRERYQTVYARVPGSVAAPTAGLHFTPELLHQIDAKGVERVAITLDVGVGTFRPVEADDPAEHDMHSERYFVPVAVLSLALILGSGIHSAVYGTPIRDPGVFDLDTLLNIPFGGYYFGALVGMVIGWIALVIVTRNMRRAFLRVSREGSTRPMHAPALAGLFTTIFLAIDVTVLLYLHNISHLSLVIPQ